MRRPWTADEDEYLAAHAEDSWADTARVLGRTRKAVQRRADKIGVTGTLRRWTPTEDALLLRYAAEGRQGIWKLLGRNRGVVSVRAKLLGLDLRQPAVERVQNGYATLRGEFVHRGIAEVAEGRKLLPRERVHHVDLDPLNNHPTNLYVCAGPREHMLAHRSIDALIPELLRSGAVRFDRDAGIYVPG